MQLNRSSACSTFTVLDPGLEAVEQIYGNQDPRTHRRRENPQHCFAAFGRIDGQRHADALRLSCVVPGIPVDTEPTLTPLHGQCVKHCVDTCVCRQAKTTENCGHRRVQHPTLW